MKPPVSVVFVTLVHVDHHVTGEDAIRPEQWIDHCSVPEILVMLADTLGLLLHVGAMMHRAVMQICGSARVAC